MSFSFNPSFEETKKDTDIPEFSLRLNRWNMSASKKSLKNRTRKDGIHLRTTDREVFLQNQRDETFLSKKDIFSKKDFKKILIFLLDNTDEESLLKGLSDLYCFTRGMRLFLCFFISLSS